MMKLRRRKPSPEPVTLAQLVLRDGIATAVSKGAVRERVPDIAPHRFTPSTSGAPYSATPFRCVVCQQPESHELHVATCPTCGRPL